MPEWKLFEINIGRGSSIAWKLMAPTSSRTKNPERFAPTFRFSVITTDNGRHGMYGYLQYLQSECCSHLRNGAALEETQAESLNPSTGINRTAQEKETVETNKLKRPHEEMDKGSEGSSARKLFCHGSEILQRPVIKVLHSPVMKSKLYSTNTGTIRRFYRSIQQFSCSVILTRAYTFCL